MLLISLQLLHAKTMMFMDKRTAGINKTINFTKKRWHVYNIFFRWSMDLEDMVEARVSRYLPVVSGDTEINKDW